MFIVNPFKISHMKLVKKIVFIAILAAPLFLVPKQSQAGILGDLLGALFGGDHDKKKDPPKPTTSNSVPLDGATIVLMAAGLGLGTKMLLGNKRKDVETVTI